VTTERFEEGPYDAFRIAEVIEQPIELAISEIRRQQVQVVVVRFLYGCAKSFAAFKALLAETGNSGPYAKGKAGCSLRAEGPEQDSLALRRCEIRQVHCRSGLPNTTLHVVDGERPHRARSPGPALLNARRQADRVSSERNLASFLTTCLRRSFRRSRLC